MGSDELLEGDVLKENPKIPDTSKNPWPLNNHVYFSPRNSK